MLVTPERNQRDKRRAFFIAFIAAAVPLALGLLNPALCWLGFLCLPAYWYARRRWRRRLELVKMPFPKAWEVLLKTRVAYFGPLDDEKKARFRQLVMVFLDETRITGIQTEVDELTRILVAASAIIPIFAFPDWEYRGLGEVLMYPSSFGMDFETEERGNILGMVGLGHLSGTMILSKPDLIAGFANPKDKRNVGIHEFAHLVDKGDGRVDGIPAGIPPEVYRPWIEWVGRELAHPPKGRSHINKYAYTNEAEYFAVLTEYLFEAPEVLASKNPKAARMLEAMFRQNATSLLAGAVLRWKRKIGRNSKCPCGSGKKYKKCCLRHAKQGMPR